jgi:hypothetical protein
MGALGCHDEDMASRPTGPETTRGMWETRPTRNKEKEFFIIGACLRTMINNLSTGRRYEQCFQLENTVVGVPLDE